jgi:hypothetical protein
MPFTNEKKVPVTINGKTIKLLQGTQGFQDIIAEAGSHGVVVSNPKLITVNVAAAAQPASINPNSSIVISGGETLTIS